MIYFRQLLAFTFINVAIISCAWQQDPTPSTLDNTVYNQNSLNMILHSVSQALGSQLISQENTQDSYTLVYLLTLKGSPTAISVISTAKNDPFFMNLMQSTSITNHLFATNNDIIHSDTQIAHISFNEISNQSVKDCLKGLGYTQKNNFLERTTYFYKDNQTLTLIDYIFPNKETNSFAAN